MNCFHTRNFQVNILTQVVRVFCSNSGSQLLRSQTPFGHYLEMGTRNGNILKSWTLNWITLILSVVGGVQIMTAQEANSLLWRVTSRNGNVSHLYGTYHTNLKDVFMFRKPAIEAYRTANVIAVEIEAEKISLDNPGMLIAAMSTIGNLVESTKGWRLSIQERYEVRDTLKSLVTRLIPVLCRNQDASIFEIEQRYGYTSTINNAISNIETDSAVHLVGLVAILRSELSDANRIKYKVRSTEKEDDNINNSLDGYLSKHAVEMGKQVLQLDDINQVAKLAPEIIGSIQNPMRLVRAKDDLGYYEIDLYKSENISQLYGNIKNEGIEVRTFKELVENRNRKWIKKLKPLLESNTCFIAVGAGHLAGDYGLIKLLRENGLKVEPVLGGDRSDIRLVDKQNAKTAMDQLTPKADVQNESEAFRVILEESLRAHMRQNNAHGILTLVLSIQRKSSGPFTKDDQVLIDFVDREELINDLDAVIKTTAANSTEYLKLGANQLYSLVIQIEY